MRWPWQDKNPKDGRQDDYPLDSFMEIYVAWIAIMLTGIFFFVVLGYIVG